MTDVYIYIYVYSIWVFFQNYSRFTWQQGKREAISSTLLYQLLPLHRRLDINWEITEESSPLT